MVSLKLAAISQAILMRGFTTCHEDSLATFGWSFLILVLHDTRIQVSLSFWVKTGIEKEILAEYISRLHGEGSLMWNAEIDSYTECGWMQSACAVLQQVARSKKPHVQRHLRGTQHSIGGFCTRINL